MLAQHERHDGPLHLIDQAASTSPAGQLSSPDTVKAGLTPKRWRRQVENDEYGAFVRRILRAYSRRVGDGDVEALALMLGLAEEIDTAIAGQGLARPGRTWGGPSRTWGEAGRYQAVPQVSLIVISGAACGPSRTPGRQSRRTES
jgi:hypothetical protein